MNAALGSAGVVLGVAASLAAIVTLALGLRGRRPELLRMSRTYAYLVFGGGLLAFAAMERALITRDFSLAYVANNGSTKTPALYNFATLWGALEGSILLWSLILAGYTVAVVTKFAKRRSDELVAWAMLTMFVVNLFFFGLMLGPANPFKTLANPPLDGPGPNPLLQNNPLMAFHPPMLYLGFVGFTVPFAFAIAALVTGRLGEGWLVETRRWTLFAWTFLTIGIVLGAWWSHEVLGWGGYWGWDPVENASFLPWITGTAYIHSVMVQERRGMLRVWNLSLLCATFALTILGTFLTRSGVLDSVHTFSNSGVGPALLGFFGLIVAVTVVLVGWRGDRLRSPSRIDSPASREGAFLLNNIVFAAFAFVVLLGTVFPLISEAITNQRVTVGPPYFERMCMPIGLTLLFLMAMAPVLPWRKASVETLRSRLIWPGWMGTGVLVFAVLVGARGFAPLLAFFLAGFAGGAATRQIVLATRRQGWRGFVGRANGGMIVHLGVIMIAVAFAASASYEVPRDAHMCLRAVEGCPSTIHVDGHTIAFTRTTSSTSPSHSQVGAVFLVDGTPYQAAIQTFPNGNQEVGKPTVKNSPLDSVLLSLGEAPTSNGSVQLKVIVQPLIVWLWTGGAVMAFGAILAAFPGKRRKPTDPVSAPAFAAGDPPDPRPLDDEPVPVGADSVKRRPALVGAVIAGIVLSLLMVLLVTRKPVGDNTAPSPLIGRQAPDLGGKVIMGKPFDLGTSDRWTVVNFFASWCVPCIREQPELKAFAEAHAKTRDAQVVSVVYGDTAADVKQFFARNGGSWTVLDSDNGRTALDWSVAKVPESFIVAPSGVVVDRFATGDGVTQAELDAVINHYAKSGS